MSAATEQQNNGGVATVEKVNTDAVKDDLKVKPAPVEDSKTTTSTTTTTTTTKPVVSTDNGTASKDEINDDDATDAVPAKKPAKAATKRPADILRFCIYVNKQLKILPSILIDREKTPDSKKPKKDNNRVILDVDETIDEDEDDEDEEDNVSVSDSDIESEEYDIPYDGEEDEIECEDDDDENDDGSGSDDQA